jgi:hypothetical protein
MRESLWLSSSLDRSSEELGCEETDEARHLAPRIVSGACSISPQPLGWTALRMAASFMQSRAEGEYNKLTRARVERKGWVGAGISHLTARILGARGHPRSKWFGRHGTRLALLGPIALGCFAHSSANEAGSCRAIGWATERRPPQALAAGRWPLGAASRGLRPQRVPPTACTT